MSRNLSAALEKMRALFSDHLAEFEDLVAIVGRINARLERLEAMIPKSVSASSAPEHENKGDDMATDGIRTERVTLEIAHWGEYPAARWDFAYCLRPLYALESVRVVSGEEPSRAAAAKEVK
jgi:hypothetical protein